MQKLCNPLNQGARDFPPAKNIEEINLINSKLKGKLCQAQPTFSTLFPYNFPYAWVITHRDKYTHCFVSCQVSERPF